MKTFKYHIDGREICVRLDEKQGTVADFLLDGRHPAVPEADMPVFAAVIALALIEHEVEIVHDEESGVITLDQTPTRWNNLASLMARMGK